MRSARRDSQGPQVPVFYARHGQTEWNRAGRWQGQADSALTEEGEADARALALSLRDAPLTQVYCSDLGRAVATAEIVASVLQLEVIRDERLREIDAGRWTGLLDAEVAATDPLLREVWKEQPWTMRLPGGETTAEALARVLNFLAGTMPSLDGQAVLIVGHRVIGRSLLTHAAGLPPQSMWALDPLVRRDSAIQLRWSQSEGLTIDDHSRVFG